MPNPSFGPKLTGGVLGWRLGAAAPHREVPSQQWAFCAPKQLFLAQNGPGTHSYRPREPVGALRVRLDCPVTMTTSPLLLSNSTICLRNNPKMAKNGPDFAQHLSTCPKTKNWPYHGLRGSKPNSKSTCNPPFFVGFNP